MNLFKRTKSIITKSSAKQPVPSPPATASPQTTDTQSNINLQQSQIPSGDHVYSAGPKLPDKPTPTRIVGAKISHRDAPDVDKPKSSNSSSPLKQDSRSSHVPSLPPKPLPHSAKSNHSDMYTQNDLQTFSFGAALANPPSSSLYPPIDPLSRRRGEGDSDEISVIPDTTPRPSVIGKQQSRARNSQPSGLEDPPIGNDPPRRSAKSPGKTRAQDSDIASSHTFGTSSGSLSSVSGPRGADSRVTSSISGYSSTTPLTSSNDMTSDDDDDDDILGRHPISNPRRTAPSRSHVTPDQNPAAEISEEEFDHDIEEFDQDTEFETLADRTNLSLHENGSSVFALALASGRRGSKSIDDLHSKSFLEDAEQSSLSLDQRPLPPTPSSLPESEGDWRELNKRSYRNDNTPPQNPASSSNDPHDSYPNSNAQGASATAEFDVSSWMKLYGEKGFVGFEPSEMTDIVGPSNLNNNRGALHPFHRGSTSSANRRQSTVSTTDMMHKNLHGKWASQKYLEEQLLWSFQKVDAHPGSNSGRRIPDRERDYRPLRTIFVTRPSTSSGHAAGSSTPVDANKPKGDKEPWCGQRLGSSETWLNGNTRYTVSRKNIEPAENSGKPLQQRLSIHCKVLSRSSLILPSMTVHKHSKTAAFSISRIYQRGFNEGKAVVSNHPHSQGSSQGSDHGPRKKSELTLFATNSVQSTYYSTNTTRKLDTHGLLDDKRGTIPSELENERNGNDRGRNRAKGKNTERSNANVEVGFTTTLPQDIAASQDPLPDSAEGSSAGSIFNALSSGDSGTLVDSSTPMTTPEQSQAHGSIGSVEQSIRSQGTSSSDRTVTRTKENRIHNRKRGIYDVDDDFDEHDCGSDDMPRYPTRTPHRETYAALPPEVFESSHQDHPSGGLFPWGRSKGNDRHGNRVNAYLENAYQPAWPVTQPRSNVEARKGIVDGLNISFQDVGLLPAIGEIKGSSHSGQNKQKRDQNLKTKDKFQCLPKDEVLYMVLPLWPSETDPSSNQIYPFKMPSIPMSDRQYLVISYNLYKKFPVVREGGGKTKREEGGKTKTGEKKRSQEAPANEGANDKNVFYLVFYLSVRVISYQDLQGSGIRIPENGLIVTGPLQEAYESIPKYNPKGENETVIGTWEGRDKGILFLSEGFEAVGLTKTVPNPNPRPRAPSDDDDGDSFDTIAILTPIGRAVMEMAWLGCLAVNSFNPHSHLY